MIIDVAGKTGNGVQLFNTATGAIRSLDSSDMVYSNLRWRKKSDDIAVYRSREEDSAFADKSFTVLTWKGASAASPAKNVYDFTTDDAFPKDMRVASDTPPQHSEGKPQGFSLNLAIDTAAEAERVFQELSEGGQVRMPLAKTFWADRFGMLVDRFGIPWMINCEVAK